MPGDDFNSRIPKLKRCSFCGKSSEQVRRMVAGPNVQICTFGPATIRRTCSLDLPQKLQRFNLGMRELKSSPGMLSPHCCLSEWGRISGCGADRFRR